MTMIHDDAIVLTRLDYSETSQVIVLLTREHGKVRAIAKGIKRGTKTRFAVGIDLLDVGHVVLSNRHGSSEALAIATEWKQTRSLAGLREKLFRIYAGQYAAEVTSRLTEDWDPHADLYEALLSMLTTLADAPEALAPLVRYQSVLLDSIGSGPRFDGCVLCGRTEDLTHFSSFEGGVVCRHCEPGRVEKWQVSMRTLEILRAFQANQGAATSGSLAGSFGTLNYHISHLMGREPRLAANLVPPDRRRIVDRSHSGAKRVRRLDT